MTDDEDEDEDEETDNTLTDDEDEDEDEDEETDNTLTDDDDYEDGIDRMTITIKLFASLRKFLPEGAEKGKAQMELPDGASLQTIIDTLQIPAQMCHLTMINGAHQKDLAQPLADGVEVSIFPPVAGGMG